MERKSFKETFEDLYEVDEDIAKLVASNFSCVHCGCVSYDCEHGWKKLTFYRAMLRRAA